MGLQNLTMKIKFALSIDLPYPVHMALDSIDYLIKTGKFKYIFTRMKYVLSYSFFGRNKLQIQSTVIL